MHKKNKILLWWFANFKCEPCNLHLQPVICDSKTAKVSYFSFANTYLNTYTWKWHILFIWIQYRRYFFLCYNMHVHFLIMSSTLPIHIEFSKWWNLLVMAYQLVKPGRVAQSVGQLTRNSEVLGSIPGLATYFHFSFLWLKRDSCQLLAKVCARSTG